MNLPNNRKTIIETFKERDIPGLIKLSASVGWDYDKDEIQTIMSSGKVYGYKNDDGTIVSSAAIIPYGSYLASIGMVIVHQDYRGQGLGKKITQACLDSVSKDTAVMLIATEEGIPMYESMEFTYTDCVHKYLCDNYIPAILDDILEVEILPMQKGDFPEVVKLDKDAFGVERRNFIRNRINQAKECLVIKNTDGRILGYGLSILGPINLILGPIVAPDHNLAFALMDRLARNHQGKLRIDIPSGNDAFMSHLEKSNFIKVSQPPIMIKNSNLLPPRSKTLYGIAAQIFG